MLIKKILLLFYITFILTGCGAGLVIGGAITSASIATDRRTPKTVTSDHIARIKALTRLKQTPLIQKKGRVAVTVYNHLLLLTGVVENQAIKQLASSKVQQIEGISKVFNEIRMGDLSDLVDEAKDAYLTSKVKLMIASIDSKGFDASRIKVVTDNKVVYLLGLVRIQEAKTIVKKVRLVSGIKEVVTAFQYFQMKKRITQ